MAVIENVAENLPPPSELESIPPSWPAPTEHRSPWRTLLVPSATSGCFHFGIVCLLVLIQFEFIPDEPASAYTQQLNQRYLIDNDADWRQFRNVNSKVTLGVLNPADAVRVNERTLATQDGEEPTVQPPIQVAGQAGGAAETVPPEYYLTFKQHILPIFEAKCGACHGEARKARGRSPHGKLDLTSVASILKGGEMGPALVPGKPKQGTLHEVVVEDEMPPKGKPQLTAAEKQLILDWIETGKPDAATAAAAAPGGPAAPQADVIFPYSPPPQRVVDAMLRLANVQKSDVIYDLGCGNGRIAVTAAKKYGARAVGVDIDPGWVKESLDNVKQNGVQDLVTIAQQDMLKMDLSGADVVTLAPSSSLNAKLLPQLEKMKPGTRIVSHDSGIAGVMPDREVEVSLAVFGGELHKIYLWTLPLMKEKPAVGPR